MFWFKFLNFEDFSPWGQKISGHHSNVVPSFCVLIFCCERRAPPFRPIPYATSRQVGRTDKRTAQAARASVCAAVRARGKLCVAAQRLPMNACIEK
jgi:hypothetical protein